MLFFFFNDAAATEIYTLSLHDALPISYGRLAARRIHEYLGGIEAGRSEAKEAGGYCAETVAGGAFSKRSEEHTSDSSHSQISYAVFCLEKKKNRPVQYFLALYTRQIPT